MGGYKAVLNSEIKPVLHFAALYAFERVRKFRFVRPQPKPVLTAREREVLKWVADGKSAWEIGEILDISKRTVDEHVNVAMRKLGAVDPTQAVVIALRDQIIAL